MTFDEVIGQRALCDRLAALARADRLPHALLLAGPAGSGKLAVALALASYLLGQPCQGRSLLQTGDGEPDGDTAQRIRRATAMLAKLEHPDLHFAFPVIKPKNASPEHKAVSDDYIGEWRQQLIASPYFTMDTWLAAMRAENQQAQIGVGESAALLRKLATKPSQGGWRVVVVWLPERMNAQCANALLKEIEEPQSHTLFVMASEEPDRLLETIRSRTQRIDVRGIDEADIAQALRERRGLDADTARRTARVAAGSWTRATEALSASSERLMMLDLFKMLMRQAYLRDIRQLKAWSEQVAGFGREKQKRALDYFTHLVREYFVYNFRRPELCYMTAEEEDFAQKFSPYVNEANVMEMSALFADARREIVQNANAKIVLFDLTMQIIIALMRKP